MNDAFLEVAKRAAREAGKIIQKYSTQAYKKDIKHGDLSDFATDADLEAEKKIIEILQKHFPDHNIVAEESGKKNKNSEYTWVIDPLDGTLTFSRGIPFYTISIGLLWNNKPFLGVVNQPALANLYWAEDKKGSFLNGNRISVSNKKILEETVGTLETGHRDKRKQKMDTYVNKLITKVGYPYQLGSAVIDLALVADGTYDFYVSEAFIWDFLAGVIIVREAGGKVTDFEGNEPDWTKERLEIVATNGLIHEAILKELQ
jgi:myo-inositol-1(or 4)-monophosphatase